MSELNPAPFIPVAQVPKPQVQNDIVETIQESAPRPSKRSRKSEIIMSNTDDTFEVNHTIKKAARRSEPGSRKVNRRASGQGLGANADVIPLTPEEDLKYCRHMINRMVTGPGFWTRLVGPFKNPVDPIADKAPNYFDVVKRPMDLRTVQSKMNKGDYSTAAEFEADIRLIFQNCYEYWTQDDQVFKSCIDLENYFNSQWNARHKWVAPPIKAEAIE